MLSASLSLVFSHKVHNIRFEKQEYVFYLNGNQTDCQFQSPQLGSQSFMTPLILNTNFIR